MQKAVLVTRPMEDAGLLAKFLEEKGYKVVCTPFLKVVFHDKLLNDLEHYSGLIFTSRNAVRSFCHNEKNRLLPVYTVGDATQDLALELGFKDVQSASGSVRDLKAILPSHKADNPLLYICGAHISHDLSAEGIQSETLYRTEKIDKIDKNTFNMIKEGVFSDILFFSTRTAEAFVNFILKNQLEQGVAHTKALCLGASMIKSLSVLPWKSVEVAKSPDRESVLALLD